MRERETLAFERDGGESEPFALSADEAIEAFHELRDRTAAAGLTMESDTIVLEPIGSLAKAIRYAVSDAAGEE